MQNYELEESELCFSLRAASQALIPIFAIVTKIIAITGAKNAEEVPSIGARATDIEPTIKFCAAPDSYRIARRFSLYRSSPEKKASISSNTFS